MQIDLDPPKRRASRASNLRFTALILLLVGLGAAWEFLEIKPPAPPQPTSLAMRIQPRPTLRPVVVNEIDSIQVQPVSLRFAGGQADVDYSHSWKDTRFSKRDIDFVWAEIEFMLPPPDRQIAFLLEMTTYKPDGSSFKEGPIEIKVDIGTTGFIFFHPLGGAQRSVWETGVYQVEVYHEGMLIATGSFEVTE